MKKIKKNTNQILLREGGDPIFRKILIVKDSHFQSKFYGIIFRHYPKCELFFVSNRLEAKDILDLGKDIDMIISDIKMPIM